MSLQQCRDRRGQHRHDGGSGSGSGSSRDIDGPRRGRVRRGDAVAEVLPNPSSLIQKPEKFVTLLLRVTSLI